MVAFILKTFHRKLLCITLLLFTASTSYSCYVQLPMAPPLKQLGSQTLECMINTMKLLLKQKLKWFKHHPSSYLVTCEAVEYLQLMETPHIYNKLERIKALFIDKQDQYKRAIANHARLIEVSDCKSQKKKNKRYINKKWKELASAFAKYREKCSAYLWYSDQLRNATAIKPEELSQFTCMCATADKLNHGRISIHVVNAPGIKEIYTVDSQQQTILARHEGGSPWSLPVCLSCRAPRTLYVVFDKYIYEWIVPTVKDTSTELLVGGPINNEEDPTCHLLKNDAPSQELVLLNKLQILG